MKDCNKKIYEKIREYLDNCLDKYVEIVIEYKDDTFGNLHQIAQYNRTASNTWLGVIGNMFDFDFFDCKEVVSFVPFRNLTPTDNSVTVVDEDDDDDFWDTVDTNHLRKIDISEIKEGDYICIDGESSFCHTSYLKISSLVNQVTTVDGKITPFLIIVDEDDDSWSSLDGSRTDGDSMYSIVGYYRYDENYSREKERKNKVEPLVCSGEEAKLIIDSFRLEWIENLFDKVVD